MSKTLRIILVWHDDEELKLLTQEESMMSYYSSLQLSLRPHCECYAIPHKHDAIKKLEEECKVCIIDSRVFSYTRGEV